MDLDGIFSSLAISGVEGVEDSTSEFGFSEREVALITHWNFVGENKTIT